MTMLGRGKRSSKDKPGKGRKGGEAVLEKDSEKGLTKEEAAAKAATAEERARRAAERAAKAEEAAEAARLAEEAAARAQEAARLAQIAADAASAEADDAGDGDAADGDAADGAKEPGEAATSLEKKRKGRKGSEVAPGGGGASADEPAASAAVPTEVETGADEIDDEDDEDLEDDDVTDEDSEDDDEDSEDDDEDSEDDDQDEDSEDEDDEDGEESEAAESDAEAGDDDAPVRLSTRRGSPVLVTGVLAVVAVALAAGAVFLGLKVREQQATADARRDAVAAASNAAKALSSYDYRTLETDLKSASATTTGDLHKEFDALAAQLRTQATQQQAVSTTTILKAGAVSAKPDEVVVLVYANRASATNKDTEPRLPEPLRIRMVMVEKDGAWLAQKLQVIS
ncbi:hypothetical protein [Actinomadura sediminis]|uniref:Mce-associated membrane protein n=1 Tax=Actinomadura sediminis TaxID=1038904 RepID=A0ABW3EPI5_9ACTN